MEVHEAVRKMTDEQRGNIIAVMIEAIPLDLSFKEAQDIIDEKGFIIADIQNIFARFRDTFAKQRLNVALDDDVWFDLEVDNDRDPMEVVASAGYNVKGWKYFGPNLSGKQMLRVKLVRLGYVPNLAEARRMADEMGYRLVEGQAREAFRAKFPKLDGRGPVVFGGSEWWSPDGDVFVTCLHGFWDQRVSSFCYSDHDFFDVWRWLVVSK